MHNIVSAIVPSENRHHRGASGGLIDDAQVVARALDFGKCEFPGTDYKASIARLSLLEKIEWVTAGLLTLTIVFLLFVRATHAGALWRDEAAIAQLATMPSIADIARNFQHEAFPPLFPIAIRGYTKLFGTSDAAFRIFGFLVGLILVAAFWINSRLLVGGVPLVSLGLLSLNTTFLVWGTTVRGYGLGSAMIVLAFTFIAKALVDPTSRHTGLAVLACLLSVQTLLHNTVLLIAIITGAAAISLVWKNFKRALVPLGLCLASLISMIPYIGAYSAARDWNVVVRTKVSLSSLLAQMDIALGNPTYAIPVLWYLLPIGLTTIAIWNLCKIRQSPLTRRQQLLWFGAITLWLAPVAYYAFLRVLSYRTSAWYYLALICVLIAALDLLAQSLATTTFARWLRVAFAWAAAVIAPFAGWSAVIERQTNIDIVARTSLERATPKDLVVVAPWQFGISFYRYYHGVTPWITLPMIHEHRFHRYDLIKTKMTAATPTEEVTQIVRDTLDSGNRVWFVGKEQGPDQGQPPTLLFPAPASSCGWDSTVYTKSWWREVNDFVLAHANRVEPAPIPPAGYTQVNRLEDATLRVAEGWHE